jgi:pyruvate/2-oxoglutarate dehydrogenase complex dihydrolipoamide acyltransferase (E2) component
MSTEIRIPKIGISMTEATLSEWLAEDGAMVDAGTPLYAMEMDKSTNEIESPVAGRLTIIGVVGEVYEIGTLIATID